MENNQLEISCDCGHLSNVNSTSRCINCFQHICNNCINNELCELCLEHNKAVNKLLLFIEINIPILNNLYSDVFKYSEYKYILHELIIIYNSIIYGYSIEYNGEIFNYLTEPKHIYDLIYDFFNILSNMISEYPIFYNEEWIISH